MPKELEKLKKYFEANYLDGDAIQKGQMHSSEDAFEAMKDGYRLGLRAL